NTITPKNAESAQQQTPENLPPQRQRRLRTNILYIAGSTQEQMQENSPYNAKDVQGQILGNSPQHQKRLRTNASKDKTSENSPHNTKDVQRHIKNAERQTLKNSSYNAEGVQNKCQRICHKNTGNSPQHQKCLRTNAGEFTQKCVQGQTHTQVPEEVPKDKYRRIRHITPKVYARELTTTSKVSNTNAGNSPKEFTTQCRRCSMTNTPHSTESTQGQMLKNLPHNAKGVQRQMPENSPQPTKKNYIQQKCQKYPNTPHSAESTQEQMLENSPHIAKEFTTQCRKRSRTNTPHNAENTQGQMLENSAHNAEGVQRQTLENLPQRQKCLKTNARKFTQRTSTREFITQCQMSQEQAPESSHAMPNVPKDKTNARRSTTLKRRLYSIKSPLASKVPG
ncbi:2281_t:CDS:2, partial [Gigaspora rosea]